MKILSLSLDQELSHFRRFALATAKHEVTSLITEKDILAASKGNAPYDVILLCHTLPSSMGRPLVRQLKEHRPQSKLLYIARIYGEWPDVEADRYVVGADGPEALIRVLDEIAAGAR